MKIRGGKIGCCLGRTSIVQRFEFLAFLREHREAALEMVETMVGIYQTIFHEMYYLRSGLAAPIGVQAKAFAVTI